MFLFLCGCKEIEAGEGGKKKLGEVKLCIFLSSAISGLAKSKKGEKESRVGGKKKKKLAEGDASRCVCA